MALFVDLVALSNELHGSIQMDWVAPPPWNTQLENACQLALDHISQPGYKNIKIILQSNQDLKDKNDNVQSECDIHAFITLQRQEQWIRVN